VKVSLVQFKNNDIVEFAGVVQSTTTAKCDHSFLFAVAVLTTLDSVAVLVVYVNLSLYVLHALHTIATVHLQSAATPLYHHAIS
jgi:hypothetical protein